MSEARMEPLKSSLYDDVVSGSYADVADVEWLGGEGEGGAPCLLVEVPHGADRRAHYDALRARLKGPLPDELHVFFHANTDVGSWQYGRFVAEQIVRARPGRRALVVRCLIPRTFVDTNRLAEATDDLAKGGLTAGLPVYVRNEGDQALLLDLHRRYVELAERAYALVCQAGGFALNPHTYGPRSMGIARVDDHIVEALREAAKPGIWESWPLRAEIDLITRTAEGELYAPVGMPEALIDAYTSLGRSVVEGGTYTLHPSAQGYRWAVGYPGQVLCLEVRRDLLTRGFDLFREQEIDDDGVAAVSGPLVEVIDEWLTARGR